VRRRCHEDEDEDEDEDATLLARLQGRAPRLPYSSCDQHLADEATTASWCRRTPACGCLHLHCERLGCDGGACGACRDEQRHASSAAKQQQQQLQLLLLLLPLPGVDSTARSSPLRSPISPQLGVA
jgi:hypothetical protein